jgi:hypothetical protein
MKRRHRQTDSRQCALPNLGCDTSDGDRIDVVDGDLAHKIPAASTVVKRYLRMSIFEADENELLLARRRIEHEAPDDPHLAAKTFGLYKGLHSRLQCHETALPRSKGEFGMVGSHLGAKLLNVRRWLDVSRSVHRTYGKNMLAQIREITCLHFGRGQLSATEYYSYGLYDDHIFSPAAKREFVGGRWAKRWYGLLNDRLWRAAADDKLVCHAMLEGLKLPLPCPYAIFHPGGRFFGSVPCFRRVKSLADYLRHEIPYPFFAKPVHGAHGRCSGAIT